MYVPGHADSNTRVGRLCHSFGRLGVKCTLYVYLMGRKLDRSTPSLNKKQ
jgi:hypothetical protein